MEKKCKNCEHYCTEYTTHITTFEHGTPRVYEAAPCRVNAVFLDSIGAVAYMAPDSDCVQYDDAFEPHAEYLEELKEAAISTEEFYGVEAGTHFPATL